MSITVNRKHRPSPSMFLAAVSLLIASASVAYAAVPDSAGAIHGCITTRTGALRLIDTETSPAGACSAGKERPITWNVQGVEGAPGQRGADGAPGPAGSITATYMRHNIGTTGNIAATVTCDTGDIVTGGGANSDGTLVDVYPYAAEVLGDIPIGYVARRSGGSSLTVYVICVDATP